MSFDDFLGTIETPGLLAVARYWNGARGTKPMPCWQDIDTARLERLHQAVWFWRYDAARASYVCQLADDPAARRMRGRSIDDLFPCASAAVLKGRFRHVLLDGLAMRSASGIYGTAGLIGFHERIALPVAPSRTMPPGIFGATAYRWEADVAPAGDVAPDETMLPACFHPLAG